MYRFLKWVWGVLLAGLALNLVAAFLFQFFEGNVLELFLAYGRWPFLGFLTLVILTYWARLTWRDRQARESFALLKPAPELLPEDIGSQVLQAGEHLDPRYRPFYHTYIPRRAILHAGWGEETPDDIYTEAAILRHLREGRGFVLLGQPLAGKSRTLYEIVSKMTGYTLVKPFTKTPMPSDTAFSFLKGRRVVLLLEDLNEYVSAEIDLWEFCQKLSPYAQHWAVAATCRDGPQLAAVKSAVGTSLQRFYENIPLKLELLPPTTQEKEQLARSLGKNWDTRASDYFPTFGFITMEEPLEAMKQRFQTLPSEQQDALRALKLLATGGIMPFSHQCLRAVLERIFDRTAIHLGDVLDALTGQAFLRHPSRQDPVFAEPAYLLSTVTYTEGKNPKDDFSALADILVELEDVMALVYLGNAYGLVPPKDIQQGLNCFERALSLRPDFPPALYNKGAVLAHQEHYAEALEIIEEALRLQPNFPEGLHTKSAVLARLGRYAEALEATESAVDLKPDDPMSWYYKATALVRLGRHEQAVVAFDQVLHLQPDFPHVWYYKGMILVSLGHSQEAGAWLYRAWQARERLKERDVSLIAQTLRDLGYTLDECEEQPPSDLHNSY